jgi:hypothetical protein
VVAALACVACSGVDVRDVDVRAGHDEVPLERVDSSEWVGQTFHADRPGLCGIEVKLGAHPRGTSLTARLALRRYPEPRDIAVAEHTLMGAEWGQACEFLFPPVEDAQGGDFYFYLQFPQSSRHEYVAVWTYPLDVYHDGTMILNGRPRTGDVHFRPLYRPSAGWTYEVETDVGQPGAYWLTGTICGPTRVGQTFRCSRDSLAAIDVLPTLLGTSPPGQVRLELKESAESQVPLRVAETVGDSLRDNQFCRFRFAPVPYSAEKVFHFSVSAPWAPENKAISLWSHRSDTYPDGKLFIREEAAPRDLVFRTYALTNDPTTTVAGPGASRWVRPRPTPPLAPGAELVQSFIAHEPNISGLELIPATYGSSYGGTATLRLWNYSNGEMLHERLVRPGTFRDNTPFRASFPPAPVQPGDSVGVEIRIESAPAQSVPLSFWQHTTNVLGSGALVLSGTRLEGDLLLASFHRMRMEEAERAVLSLLTGGKPGLLAREETYLVLLATYTTALVAAIAGLVLWIRGATRKGDA